MLYWIWLNELKGCGPAEKRRLIVQYGTPQVVYEVMSGRMDTTRVSNEGLSGRMDTPHVACEGLSGKIDKTQLSLEKAKRILDVCERKKIYITPYKDFGIMDMNDLPIILYCRGEFRTGMRSVGIVGSRRCTEYGKSITETISKQLAARGVTIVSGMAKGVDSYAHNAALSVGGYTIAVLGCGIDICYPSEHKILYESIIEKGLVISEYSPGHPAGHETFPRRNRIIAAFSDSILVTEAGRISGALITAEDSLLYGKRLYACPGRIDSPTSEGCNRLIAEGKARLYMPGDLLEDENEQLTLPGIFSEPASVTPALESAPSSAAVGRRLMQEKTSSAQGNSETRVIMDLLKISEGKTTIPEVAEILQKDSASLYGVLTEMEMNDLICVEGDRVWLHK